MYSLLKMLNILPIYLRLSFKYVIFEHFRGFFYN